MVFCLGFCFIVWRLVPENVRNFLLMSGVPFWGRSLSLSLFLLGWFRRRFVRFLFCIFFFVSRDRAQVVTGHTPHAFFWSVSFVLSPPRLFITRSGRASFFSGVLSGCLSGPRAFWRFFFFFFRILLVLWGLETTRPF